MIFLSYRKSENAIEARLLKFELEKHFGEENVFLDSMDIQPGDSWSEKLTSTLRSTQVMIVIIGSNWLGSQDHWSGMRRIDNPDDFVRREISFSIANEIPLIPILIDDAKIPRAEFLPEEIKKLTYYQFIRIRTDNFSEDATHLAHQIGKFYEKPPKKPLQERKSIFISYSTKNLNEAEKLRDDLKRNGFEVFIDKIDFKPGELIKNHIENFVRNSDVTISIISQESLYSTWVITEILRSFDKEKNSNQISFLACYLDKSFLSRDFADNLFDYVDSEIKDLTKRISNRLINMGNINEYAEDLDRYFEMKFHLDKIFKRLRTSVCIDISEDTYDQSLIKIIETLS